MTWTTSTADMIESAWGLIANAYGGDWMAANPEWQEAAVAWRDRFHRYLDENPGLLAAAAEAETRGGNDG